MATKTKPSTKRIDPNLREQFYAPDLADKAVQFISSLKHTKGDFAGKPFKLQKWQEDEIIRPLFGTVWEDGTRVFRKAYISTPKKNGKTELGAAIQLYMLHGDGEMSAENYSAAGDKSQASLVFDAAKFMTSKTSLKYKSNVVDSRKRIVVYSTNSFYQVVAADGQLRQGINPHCVTYDELHVAKNRKLWDAFSSARGARRQPLLIALTTAGFDRNSICWEIYKHAKDVLEARKKGQEIDAYFFAYIAEADEKDDWTDREIWKKANPSLGVTVQMDFLEEEFLSAKRNPAEENKFRQYYLNQWTESSSKWVSSVDWNASRGDVKEVELLKEDCYGGLDLAKTTDLASYVLAFPREDNIIKLLPFFWIPADRVKEKEQKDGAPYSTWITQGFVFTTPGNVIDYGFIREHILRLSGKFKILESAYDDWAATQIIQELEGENMAMIPMRQGYKSLTAPTLELETRVLQKKIHHGNNPVLAWMIGNTVVERNAAGGIKPSKEKSTKKIDGIVASIMAIDRIIRKAGDNGKSVYDTRGIRTL